MSSILGSSQSVVLATAMAAAVSGTFILFAFKSHKSLSSSSPSPSHFHLRPCLSSGEKKGERKKKKRVRFAEDVVEPTGDGELFRRAHHGGGGGGGGGQRRRMPANRAVLYNGMLRDRVVHRLACTY